MRFGEEQGGGKWAGRLRAESTRERVDGAMLEQEGSLGPGNPRHQRRGTVGETRYDPSCRIDLQGILGLANSKSKDCEVEGENLLNFVSATSPLRNSCGFYRKEESAMLATVAATGVTRSSNLAYGHKPQGRLPSLSDPLGLLVFAALRPYGPYAHASRVACASPNQVNASPCSGPSSDAMNWQPVPRIEQGGQYASHGDPYAMQPGAPVPQVIGAGLSTEEQHFLSSCTTREHQEMTRRKTEHMVCSRQPVIRPTTREHQEMARRKAEHLECSRQPVLRPAGDARIGPARRADSSLIDQLSETSSRPGDDSKQPITRLIIRIFPRRKAGQLATVKTSAMELSHKNVAIFFHLPLHIAASKLGISPTTLKRACRKIGIFKWPFRLFEHKKLEVAADAREAARKLRLLNPQPAIPATDPATLDCSRNSTPYSSPAADVYIPDRHPYRIRNQPDMGWHDAMSSDIIETVRLLMEENRRLKSLAEQQEENRRLLLVLAWPATAPVGTRHNEQSGGSIFKSPCLAPPSRGCISNLLNP
jgi:hypothetical protein